MESVLVPVAHCMSDRLASQSTRISRLRWCGFSLLFRYGSPSILAGICLVLRFSIVSLGVGIDLTSHCCHCESKYYAVAVGHSYPLNDD